MGLEGEDKSTRKLKALAAAWRRDGKRKKNKVNLGDGSQ